MTIPHFTWCITANQRMIFHSLMLLKSLKLYKKCNKYYCTIFVLEKERNLIPKELENECEILTYKNNLNLITPWNSTPKWNVSPKGDVIVGLDSDVILFNPSELSKYIKLCDQNQSVCATIACTNPFYYKNYKKFEWTNDDWLRLADNMDIKMDFNYFSTQTKKSCPLYFNNGVVLIPCKYLDLYREKIKHYTSKIVKFMGNEHHFISQIATTFSMLKNNFNFIPMDKYFNFLETANFCHNTNKIVFYHYNVSRDFFSNKKEICNLNNFFLKSYIQMLINIRCN